MSVSSNRLIDVSFAGARITVAGITIDNFMDDANPVEFQDTEVSAVGMNCNGVMIRYARPSAVMMSVTVIPGSAEDAKLYRLWAKYRVQDGNNNSSQWEQPLTCVITTKGSRAAHYTFGGGTMVSGPGGPSANGEGKMMGRTYTFAFAVVNI